MTSTAINFSRITSTGLCTSLMILLNLLTACNLTQAQDQKSFRQQRMERLQGNNSPETFENTNMPLEEFSYQGARRNYYVYTPSSYSSNKPMPLVMAFHGSSGRVDRLKEESGLNNLAEQRGFIVVYPKAVNKIWTNNDVSFVGALIDHLERSMNIDRNREYAVGASAGGIFTQKLACEMSNRFTAFATVIATMPKQLSSTCNPPRAVPIIMFNGTDDPIVHWGGGEPGNAARAAQLLSVKETVEFWRRKNACSSNPTVTQLPNTQPDGTDVVKSQYSGCRNGSQVVLYTIEGGGHTWPGSPVQSTSVQRSRGLRASAENRVSRDIRAQDVIWDFFDRYTSR